MARERQELFDLNLCFLMIGWSGFEVRSTQIVLGEDTKRAAHTFLGLRSAVGGLG